MVNTSRPEVAFQVLGLILTSTITAEEVHTFTGKDLDLFDVGLRALQSFTFCLEKVYIDVVGLSINVRDKIPMSISCEGLKMTADIRVDTMEKPRIFGVGLLRNRFPSLFAFETGSA